MTVVPTETKVCFQCKHAKPLLQFHRVSRNRDGRHSWCKECCRLNQRQWNARNKETLKRQNSERSRSPEQQARYYRRHTLKSYGLTEDDYDRLLEEQDNTCAICGAPPRPETETRAWRLRVDHDHETGMVRGLLCNKCNSAIGMLRDDLNLVEKALEYLRTPPASRLQEGGGANG